MANENASRTRYGEAFWRAHHEAWRRSDLNQREYCEAQSIPLKAFGNWRAKFNAQPQPLGRKLLYRRGGLSHPLSHTLSHPLSHMTYPSSLLSGPVVLPAREGHRRRFSEADRRRILEEASLPDGGLAKIARRYGHRSAYPVSLEAGAGGRVSVRRGADHGCGCTVWCAMRRRGASPMTLLPPSVKVHLAFGYTDMRKGIDGLAMLVQGVLRQDPFSGHLFVFRGRKADLIKIVFWDGTGLCLFTKRLEQSVFVWPSNVEPGGTLALSSAQLSMLIDGVDWRAPERQWRPVAAG
jgi:transposase